MPKVLLVIGDATEVLDTMYPFFRLPEDGFEVVVAGPEKKLYHMVLHTHRDSRRGTRCPLANDTRRSLA